MAKLSDTQLMILSAAAQREDGAIVLPEKLKGSAAQTVVDSLLGRNLVTEVERVGEMPVWRTEEDGVRYALRITAQALSEIGIEPEPTEPPADAPEITPPAPVAPDAATAETLRGTRPASKQARVIEMLRRPEGATLEQLVEATGWQKHTVRGAIAGALKKKLGLAVSTHKAEGAERIYRIKS